VLLLHIQTAARVAAFLLRQPLSVSRAVEPTVGLGATAERQLDSHWTHTGLTPDSHWTHTGLTLDSHWTHAGLTLDPHRTHAGLTLGCRWSQANEHHRCIDGSTDAYWPLQEPLDQLAVHLQ
jgi:hypothetical protein